jgi:hypothetical protein
MVPGKSSGISITRKSPAGEIGGQATQQDENSADFLCLLHNTLGFH